MLKKYSPFGVIGESIRERGAKRTLQILVAFARDYLFDLRYGTDTFGWADLNDLKIDSLHIDQGEDYVPTKAAALRSLFSGTQIPRNGDFVDFGCGKGRTLLLASEHHFRKVIGVEFSPELCDIARKNIRKWKAKNQALTTEFEVLNMDASAFKFRGTECVLYFFNPFGSDIMALVIENLVKSIAPNGTWPVIIYNNPLHSRAIESNSPYRMVQTLRFGGNDFSVFTVPEPNDDGASSSQRTGVA